MGLTVIDYEPYISITDKGVDLELAVAVDFLCKKKID